MSEGVAYKKRKEPCGFENCRSKLFYTEGGYTFCKEGHRQETIQETQEEEGDFVAQSQKTRRKREAEEKISKVYHGPEAMKLYLESYQLILRKQCKALIQTFDLPAELEQIVKDLWSLRLRLLANRLDTASDEAAVFSSQATSDAETASQSTRGRRERMSSSKKIPTLIDSLGLCYLGMILLRLPISLGDFHRWACREDVPYVRAVRYVPSAMKDKLPATYLMALDIHSILGSDDLRKSIHELSLFYYHHFDMTFPVLNHPLLLFKHIRGLALPLDVFPVVCRTAKLLSMDFTFPQPGFRQRVSSFPELALMALLVIAVKLYYPFDAIDRHPKSMTDPGVLAIDWDQWCEAQKDFDSKEVPDGRLGQGNEIKVEEKNVFKMSGDQMDEYLDWFEKTWVDEDRARKHPRGYPEQLLDMFPTGGTGVSANDRVLSIQAHQDREDRLEQKLRTVQGHLKIREVIPSHDAGMNGEAVNRIGSYYKRYRKEEDLPASARSFHEAAADLIAVKLSTLLIAVMQIEHKLIRWRRKDPREKETSDDDFER